MARLYESGGGGTGPNAGKTAAEIVAETPKRKPTSQEILQGVNDTLASLPQSLKDTQAAIDEANAAVAGAEAAMTEAAVYNPPERKPPVIADAAYDAMVAGIGIYKIQGIADTLAQIRSDYPGATIEDILTLLRNDARYNKAYKERFSGNDGLIAAGKMPLDEKTYFDNEQAYEKMFKAYDLGQFANTKQYATLIGNGIAPTEATTRVSSVYNRVLNNVSTLGVFQRYYKMLSISDIVAGVLDPKEQLPALERKITSAEIGGAAVRQGLDAYQAATDTYESRKMYSNVTTGTIGSDVIAASGETGAEATVDYNTIAQRLPVMEKLSAISGSGLDQYGQQQAEEDVILGLASAKRKKEALLAAEAGRWSGATGASQGAFSNKMF